MNYLAHLYLSGDNAEIKVGNFIGDHVKGQQFKRYKQPIQTGIILHRHIDTYTDHHPRFRESAALFKEGFGRYAGVVCDMVYDHLLAANWEYYAPDKLHSFVSETHRTLIRYYFCLPRRVKQFLPFLIKSRRLESYKSLAGIEKALTIMASHSSLPNRSKWAVNQIARHYKELDQQFRAFLPEIKDSSQTFLERQSLQTSPDHTVPSR